MGLVSNKPHPTLNLFDYLPVRRDNLRAAFVTAGRNICLVIELHVFIHPVIRINDDLALN